MHRAATVIGGAGGGSVNDRPKYVISIDPLLARIDWHEAPILANITEALQSVVASPGYHPDLRLLMVDHGTGFAMDEGQVRSAVEAVIPLMGRFKASALSVATETHYAIARQFSAHFLRSGIVSGAFKDDVAAGVWLLGHGQAPADR
jgi:hypothetical protein